MRESVDTRSRVVEAAARLLGESGAAGVTTRAVATAAGVPAPTLFRLFGDKDGLMDAVAEHVLATYAAAKSEVAATEAGDPVEDLRAAWRAHLEFGLANPDLFVLLTSPATARRSAAAEAGLAVLAARISRIAAAGLLAVPESRAVEMVHAAGTGAVLALLHQQAPGRDLGLADAMLDAVLGAVLTRTPAPPTSALAPLVVAFRAAVPDLPALTAAELTLLTQWLDRALAGLSGRG